MTVFISANDAITPSSLSGLEFWVKSSSGITKDGSNNVSAWNDQSGNARNLSEATNQPLWVDATLNGYPIIRFDGTNDKLATADFTVAPPFHCFVVMRLLSAAATGVQVHFDNDIGNTTAAKIQTTTAPAIRLQSNSLESPNISIFTNTWYLVEGLFNGTSSTCNVNNGTPSGDADNLSSAVDGIVLGARFDTNFSNVEIAEVALYSAAITGVDLIKLREYFNNRYNLY